MIHSARKKKKKVSSLMCSHVPPLKEKAFFFSELYGGLFHPALYPGASASLSQWSAGTEVEGSVH